VLGSKIHPKQNNSTLINPSQGSTMTHEEEELQHDISKLWDQVQQIYDFPLAKLALMGINSLDRGNFIFGICHCLTIN